jgi:hypothetical protein
VLDEVQRCLDLFPTLRVLADRRSLRARFLVLASASPDLLRQSAESLAGRVAFYELPPLSLSEVGVMTSVDLLGFLMLGLLGGFGHCVGMCSPFVLLVPRRYAPAAEGHRAALGAQLWYSAGRLLTYTVLGAVAGLAGAVVELAGSLFGLQRAALVVTGLLLVLEALLGLAGSGPLASATGGALFDRVTNAIGRRTPGHPFALGLLLGLLPCGLLYSAVIAAVSRGGALSGATALLLFGLGTVPALLGVAVADRLLTRHRAALDRIVRVFLLAMGAWFVWNGLR